MNRCQFCDKDLGPDFWSLTVDSKACCVECFYDRFELVWDPRTDRKFVQPLAVSDELVRDLIGLGRERRKT